ncbi:ABC transporter permease [Aquihabitans daechungensis]|uniref:ABC transporter permease n=1 Tax=Aquihabitans daechungensis TaxID=1052257 RepID=UPI003BA1F0A2
MNALLAGEWLKLRTTRLLPVMVAAAVALSMLAVGGTTLATKRSEIGLESDEGLRRILSVSGTGAVVVLLLGVLIAAGEYRHGTATDTFLTTPKRHRVVTAKLAIGAAVGASTGLLIVLGTLAALAFGLPAKDSSVPISDGLMWATLAGTVAYSTLFAVLGVALGALLRQQVLAVALALGWIAIVEHILVNFVPSIGRWLPAAAGQAIVRTPLDDLLPPLGGALVLAAYSIAVALVGIWVTTTRDA